MREDEGLRTHDMTVGHPLKLLVAFALPLMLGNIFQQLYTMVDTIIVGQGVGVNALAAVGASDWLNWMVLGGVLGMAQGFCIKMAQDFGAKDEAALRKTVANSVVLSAIISVVFMALALLLLNPVLRLMNTPENIFGMAVQYISIIFIGIPVVMAYNLLASILRAVGDSRSPLIAMIIASLLNVVLDLLFVIVFGWGVVGAAVATVLAQAVSGLFCLRVVMNLPMMRLKREDFRMDWKLSAHLLKLGTPIALQTVIIAVGGIIVQSVVNGFGVLFIAGFTATNKMYGLLELAATAFGSAIVTYAGQNYGAKAYKRIRDGLKSEILLGLIVSVVIAAVMLVFGRPIVGLFVSGTPEEIAQTVDVAYHYLSIMSVFLPVLYILYILRSNIQGLGDTVLPMVSGVAEFAMRVVAALVLPLMMGQNGIFYAEILAWLGADVVLLCATFKHMKKLRRLENA